MGQPLRIKRDHYLGSAKSRPEQEVLEGVKGDESPALKARSRLEAHFQRPVQHRHKQAARPPTPHIPLVRIGTTVLVDRKAVGECHTSRTSIPVSVRFGILTFRQNEDHDTNI